MESSVTTTNANVVSHSFQIALEGNPPADLKTFAYAFDRSGNLLASAPVESGKFNLPLSTAQLQSARLLFGMPTPGQEKKAITLAGLQKQNAYEAVFKLNAQGVTALSPIPAIYWPWWHWCSCRVRGQVLRNVGGVDRPVCHARVHVYTVEWLHRIIFRLTDQHILRLRDDLLSELKKPLPVPVLPHVLPVDINPIHPTIPPVPPAVASQPVSTLNKVSPLQPLNPQPATVAHLSPVGAGTILPIQTLKTETLTALTSQSTVAVRNALISQTVLIYPYLCLWNWWWWWFEDIDEVAVVETDANGRFDTTFWHPCNEHPGMYLKVEAPINGVWTTVYDPGVPCHTNWNYVCGSDVVIHITDTRVPVCGLPTTVPGNVLVIKSIGANLPIEHIHAPSSLPAISAGLTTNGAPLGGSLEPHVDWGNGLSAPGVDATHYLWSYRRLSLSDAVTPVSVPDIWHPIQTPLTRHYYKDVNGDGVPTLIPFVVLPDTHGHFPIQPVLPSDHFPGFDFFFQSGDGRLDMASAMWDTVSLNSLNPDSVAGKYELKLELFKNDGSIIAWNTGGIAAFTPHDAAPDDRITPLGANPGMPDYLITSGGNITAFRMVVHVDNNPVTAIINDTIVGGHGAGSCGFINYGANTTADISFVATHPHNFANFQFQIIKGGSVIGNTGAQPVGTHTVPVGGLSGNYTLTGGTYDSGASISVASLIGGCPNGAAAFAEELWVWGTATDGWYLTYTASPYPVVKAFALAP